VSELSGWRRVLRPTRVHRLCRDRPARGGARGFRRFKAGTGRNGHEPTPAQVSEFSVQKAHDDGELFTPPSLVQTIVNVVGPARATRLAPSRRPCPRESKSATRRRPRSRPPLNCHIQMVAKAMLFVDLLTPVDSLQKQVSRLINIKLTIVAITTDRRKFAADLLQIALKVICGPTTGCSPGPPSR